MEISICFVAIFAFAAWDSWLTHKENIERIRNEREHVEPPTRDGDGGRDG